MKISKETLIELRKKLYRGSNQKIKARLLDQDITFSQQYISSCLNPDHPDYNQIIIEEAIKLVEEDTIQISELCQRIGLLDNAIV